MNIIEAVQSGKKIKRKSWVVSHYYSVSEISFNNTEVLADDWEIKPEEPVRPELPEPILSAHSALGKIERAKINELIDCVKDLRQRVDKLEGE